MSSVREHLPEDMLHWLDGMRTAFGDVKLKHVVTPTFEAGAEPCPEVLSYTERAHERGLKGEAA